MAVGFSIPFFFVIFREASIIVSILLAFIKTRFRDDDKIRKLLFRSVWLGTAAGFIIALAIGGAFLAVWFKYASDLWSRTEALWEAIFELVACVLLTVMAFAFLKSDSLTAKWQRKLNKALAESNITPSTTDVDGITAQETTTMVASDENSEGSEIKIAVKSISSGLDVDKGAVRSLFWIPFVTVLREGLEGVVFLGGITLSESASDIPLAVIVGLICGFLVGFAIYRAGNTVKLHTFFITASIFILYLSAGFMAKSVSMFELNTWNNLLGTFDSDDSGYYNVFTSVWYLDCCNPEDPNAGGWQFFNAILGWTNSATIGSIVSYVLYWLLVAAILISMKLMDRRRERLGKEKVGFKKMVKGLFVRQQ